MYMLGFLEAAPCAAKIIPALSRSDGTEKNERMLNMKTRLKFLPLMLAALLLVGTACSAGADGFAYAYDSLVTITYSRNVNVRAGGGTEYSVIGTAYSGAAYRYIGQTATGWYVIELDSGIVGCISPSMGTVGRGYVDTPGYDTGSYDGTCSFQIGTVRVSQPLGGYIDMYTRYDEDAQFLRHVFNGTYICTGHLYGYYIIVCNGFIGYISDSDATFTENRVSTYRPDAIGKVWIETADMVNVRTGPNQYTELAMSVCPGSSYLCTGIDADTGWYQILLPTGVTGYISPKIGTLTGLGNG